MTPQHLIDQYSADGVRYWAALARPGTDTAFEEKQMKTGRRLVVKLLNASRFSLDSNPATADSVGDVTNPLDVSVLAFVKQTVSELTESLARFDYASGLQALERSFWSFCDFYIELSKERVYGAGGEGAQRSAQATLRVAMETYLRCFAPYLPFVTEEVWSKNHDTSVHREAWPPRDDVSAGSSTVYESAVEALRAARTAKGRAGVSVGTPVDHIELAVPHGRGDALEAVINDMKYACRAKTITVREDNVEAIDASITLIVEVTAGSATRL